MRRLEIFLVVLGLSLSAFVALSLWYLSSYQAGNASMLGMMGQMMGNQYAAGMASPMPSYVWLPAMGALGLTFLGVAGLSYYMAFPEIKPSNPRSIGDTVTSASPKALGGWAFLLRTSKPDERKVLEVLVSHDGKYLQKFIVRESGLSRLRTHRILSRYAERGIVTAERTGNTNEISLAVWLKEDAAKSVSRQDSYK